MGRPKRSYFQERAPSPFIHFLFLTFEFSKKRRFMCGIYTVVLQSEKNQDAGKKVLDGLKRLEYRGYDSWGVAVVADGKNEVGKNAGQNREMKKITISRAKKGTRHTRQSTP